MALTPLLHWQMTCQILAAPQQKHAIVHVIAPASKTVSSELTAITDYLTTVGLPFYLPTNLYGEDPLYANSDDARAGHLITALTDDSRFIWCLRGGYGSARLIPYLERLPPEVKAKIRDNRTQKIVIGYSDITALQLYLQKKYQWPALHATMLSEIINHKVAPQSVDQLLAFITAPPKSIVIPQLTLLSQKALPNDFKLEARVVGGNLTLVETSLGTCWQLAAANQFLFLEDVALPPAALECRLDHLRQAGIFDGVKAVIFGDLTQSGNQPLTAIVQQRFAQSVAFPVFSLQGIGHGYRKTPLPLNTLATLQAVAGPSGPFSLTVAAPYS
ncbi:LD-carboxypeptidase [unidentified bacterial endosymbiont]|uniref:LD-carboxypeptidase n=1 Tax=unidentified bacterial endosymbiont TaxID=2355 RepID=UPI00209F68B3|nr:LD-carboxypeptidase [unidentified bacterial endosymbiont]